jgi:hypothetical protein
VIPTQEKGMVDSERERKGEKGKVCQVENFAIFAEAGWRLFESGDTGSCYCIYVHHCLLP